MSGVASVLPRQRRSRIALAALVPAMAAAAIGVPCACSDDPDHPPASAEVAAAAHGMTAAEHAAMTTDAPLAGGRNLASSRDHATGHRSANAASAAAPASLSRADGEAGSRSFHVGTRARPLVTEGPAGPLWAPTPPSRAGSAKYGMARMDAATGRGTPATTTDAGTLATRAALTSAQATEKLSRRCQKLVKLRSTRKLSKTDRKRRTKCLAQRRDLIAASKGPASSEVAPTTGVAAPAPAVAGPAPAQPGATPTPSPTPPAASTPKPGIDPSTVPCALGVTALDVDPLKPFKMSRGVACVDETGELDIELTNNDRQTHNIGIRSPGKPSTLVPLILDVPMGERATIAAKLTPGTYEVVCMVVGHGAMTVKLTVLSKADFIAQGYAG